MKRHADLKELVAELQAQNLQKKDFVIGSNHLSMLDGKLLITNFDTQNEGLSGLLSSLGISTDNKATFECLEIMHENLSDRLEIPRKYYYKLMAEEENGTNGILDTNVTYWLNKVNKKYFLRTFVRKDENKGFARALLSDRFNVIDNYDVLLACLDAVKDSGLNLKIDENGCDLTEGRMYVRFINPDVEIQAPELLKNYRSPDGGGLAVGNGIVSGFVITNSEVGKGSFSISPRAKILKCSNGMVFHDDAFSKVHLGGKMNEYSSIDWSENTRQKNYDLIIAQTKDFIAKFASEEYLSGKIADLHEYAKQKLDNPVDCIRNVTKSLMVTDEKERDILNFFMQGGDTSALGVSQAITFYAHETKNADEQYELELAATNILPKIKEFDKPFVQKSVKKQAQMN